jgi:prephenate dehydrogenase
MSKKPFGKVTLCGVGLMGGSLGLALQEKGLAQRVCGYGRSRERLEKALEAGVVQEVATDIATAAEDADLVVICLPVKLIPSTLIAFSESCPDRAILTDIGSTKAWIVSEVEDAIRQPGPLFIGSHPMCGSEKNGFESAKADLYEGSTCVITPNKKTADWAVQRASDLWNGIGGRLLVLDPDEHDRLVARTSHLPRSVAAALCHALEREMEAEKRDRLVATGFLGATRTASSDEETWAQIFETNRENLLDAIGDMQACLSALHEILAQEDQVRLKEWLLEGRSIRQRLAKDATKPKVSSGS